LPTIVAWKAYSSEASGVSPGEVAVEPDFDHGVEDNANTVSAVIE
jgi:hypothetical protein